MSEKDLSMEVDEAEDSNNSDSGSSDEQDEEEKQVLVRAKELENNIADNKYLYNDHEELIGIFEKLGDLTSLRAAFQRFHEYFPLTPKLWLKWIKIEISLASTAEQQKDVFKLFDVATEDYLSVDLWMEYAQYSIGATELDMTRSILERALNAGGLCCDKGSLLWDTLRELENAHIALHAEGSEEWKKQILRLADVFKRQLSVPLLDMENTYSEWQEWSQQLPEGLVDPKPIEYAYNKALKLLELYKPYEEELLTCESTNQTYEVYKMYIKSVKDPSTIVCLYERAALPLCLLPEFWVEYSNDTFKLGQQALVVCKKALRNCPWSEDLWIQKMRVLEHLQKAEEDVMDCFEQGISSITPSSGLELWLAYLEYTHRCVGSPEKLDKLFNQAIHQLGFKNDPQCKISRFFSRFLAHRGDMKEARRIWSQIMSKPENKASSALWLEYANLEKQYGEPHMLRSLFQKALNAIKDWPQYIIEEWLMYERQFGTLEEVLKCVQKCKEVSYNFSETYQYQQQTANEDIRSQKHTNQDTLGKGKKRKFGREQEKAPEQKRSREEQQGEAKKAVIAKNKAPIDKNPNTTVFISNLHPSVDEDNLKVLFPNAVNLELAIDRKGKSRCFGYVQFKTQEEVLVALARDREPLDGRPVFISEIKADRTEKKPIFKYARNEEKNKLFVKGLPIKKTCTEIDDIFKKYGAIDVRLVLHKSGQPKGLAYVEFENEEAAQKALKETDRMEIDGHTISVAISAPPPKKERPQKGLFGNKFERAEEPIRHARSRLQTSLIPRSVQVKKDEGSSSGAQQEPNNGLESKKMKSNSDFRNMLLNK